MSTRFVSTHNQWETRFGYARAARRGNTLFSTGTVALNDSGNPYAPNDPYEQAIRCYTTILGAFSELGAQRSDIMRTRMFVTDITMNEEFGRAHKDFFADHTPCLTMVEVSRLINDAFLIEIEADAIIDA